MVTAVPFPAIIAPRKTIIPNKPGIKLLRNTFAPYTAEKAGPVPLPPIFIDKNMATIKGNSNGLNNGEIILSLFKIVSIRFSQQNCLLFLGFKINHDLIATTVKYYFLH
jgi:hypothetical protein